MRKKKINNDNNFVRLWKFVQSLFSPVTRAVYGYERESIEELVRALEHQYQGFTKVNPIPPWMVDLLKEKKKGKRKGGSSGETGIRHSWSD
ncbi:MAG: hypothetical protein V3U54_07730 [Thermodesulfobacteriota bacterium]